MTSDVTESCVMNQEIKSYINIHRLLIYPGFGKNVPEQWEQPVLPVYLFAEKTYYLRSVPLPGTSPL